MIRQIRTGEGLHFPPIRQLTRTKNRFSRQLVAAVGVVFLWTGLVAFAAPVSKREKETPPEEIVLQYGRAFYARDLSTAYQFISAIDRQLKDEASYVRERGAFRGFTLEISKQLADYIEAVPLEKTIKDGRAEVTLKVRLPDANAAALQELLGEWDEEKLNALPSKEQQHIRQQLAQWHNEGKISFIEGEETFTLVKEEGGWKVFLNWAAGVRLIFNTLVPPSLPLEALPVQREVITPGGEFLQVYFRVKNRSDHPVSTRIIHHVAPQESAKYVELVECGLLFPITVEAWAEKEYFSVYYVLGDVPEQERKFDITYEFVQPDEKR